MNIGLMGFGTVGIGVYEILNLRQTDDKRMERYKVAKIFVRDINKKRNVVFDNALLTDDPNDILEDASIDVVVCVMGGSEPEYTYIKKALAMGKHVVTANKQIVSEHIDELLELAKTNDVNFMFEASVGGGIPVISTVTELMRFNNIRRIQGILNGTTNYILTKIAKEHRSFSDILSEAQEIGFAEADPSADIEGHDISRKIQILSSIAFKHVIPQNEVHRRGISNITLEDVTYAESMGYNIKYIAQGLIHNNRYSISVTPVLIAKDQIIGNVNEEYNTILLDCDILGTLCLTGKGAGKDATANAVVSDIIKVTSIFNPYNSLKFNANVESSGLEGISNEYFVRIKLEGLETLVRYLDIVEKYVQKNSFTIKHGMLFVLTEEISSEMMNEMYKELIATNGDVFYARIERNFL